MSDAKVILKAVESYDQKLIDKSVAEIFDTFNGQINISHGHRVLLKPNFIAPVPVDSGAVTHPALLIATAKIIIDMGATPFVADSPAWANTQKCIEIFGYTNEFDKLGIEIAQLDQPTRTEVKNSKVGISKVALQADRIINIPKYKSHQQLGATFAIKNMYGTIPGKEKALWHFLKGKDYDDFCRMVVNIYQRLNPILTIIDGITAMEGKGPLSGNPRHLGVIVAGTDPLACERVCAEIGNFDIDLLPLFQMAKQMNLGCGDLDKIEVIGNSIDSLRCPNFVHPEQIPLFFSFTRICKSLCKQILITIKNLYHRGSAPSK